MACLSLTTTAAVDATPRCHAQWITSAVTGTSSSSIKTRPRSRWPARGQGAGSKGIRAQPEGDGLGEAPEAIADGDGKPGGAVAEPCSSWSACCRSATILWMCCW